MLPIFISAINNETDRNFSEILYYEHKGKIYKAIYKILNNQQDAEDITAETFIKIIDNLQDYYGKPYEELASIFVTIAKNLAINRYNRNNKIKFTPISEADAESEESELYSDEVGDFVVQKDLYERLHAAVGMLDEQYSSIVKLKLGYNYSDKEIAKILGITDGTVRVRYHRAKKLITEILKGDSEDGQ